MMRATKSKIRTKSYNRTDNLNLKRKPIKKQNTEDKVNNKLLKYIVSKLTLLECFYLGTSLRWTAKKNKRLKKKCNIILNLSVLLYIIMTAGSLVMGVELTEKAKEFRQMEKDFKATEIQVSLLESKLNKINGEILSTEGFIESYGLYKYSDTPILVIDSQTDI